MRNFLAFIKVGQICHNDHDFVVSRVRTNIHQCVSWVWPVQPKLNLDNAAVIGAAVLAGSVAAQKYGNKILELVCSSHKQ